MNKVFLGGTCNNSTWRDELIPLLTIDYFNPVVENWTVEDQKEEESQKNNLCNIHLYVITKEMKGVYSIAEAVESVFNKEKKTIFFILEEGFDEAELKSLRAVERIILDNGGAVASKGESIEMLAEYLNYIPPVLR